MRYSFLSRLYTFRHRILWDEEQKLLCVHEKFLRRLFKCKKKFALMIVCVPLMNLIQTWYFSSFLAILLTSLFPSSSSSFLCVHVGLCESFQRERENYIFFSANILNWWCRGMSSIFDLSFFQFGQIQAFSNCFGPQFRHSFESLVPIYYTLSIHLLLNLSFNLPPPLS